MTAIKIKPIIPACRTLAKLALEVTIDGKQILCPLVIGKDINNQPIEKPFFWINTEKDTRGCLFYLNKRKAPVSFPDSFNSLVILEKDGKLSDKHTPHRFDILGQLNK